MRLKIHFLKLLLDYFPENLGSLSEEQAERLHEDVKEIEKIYQRRWNINMLADNCWMLKREVPESTHRRKRPEITFTKKTVVTVILMHVRNNYRETNIFVNCV